MNRIRKLVLIFGIACLTATAMSAQTDKVSTMAAPPVQAAPPKYYHLDFSVKELEGGKVINSRSYRVLVGTVSGRGVIRTGSKVPVPTGQNTFNYMDVGVSIDCNAVKEHEGQLSLWVGAELSGLAGGTEAPSAASSPVVRQNKWQADVVVPFGKPTVIFSSDDVTGKRTTQLELLANPLK